MKYAFIALIACYLLVYGCGPDNSKKAEEKKGQAVHSTVEKPLPPTPAAAPPETVNQPTAAPAATQPTQQTAAAPPSQAPPEDPQQPPAAAEGQNTDMAGQEQQPPCKMMNGQPGTVELTQPDDENIVVMPCGCMFVKHQVPANAPCLRGQVPPCPMIGGKQPMAQEELIMMPCGRVFVRQLLPTDDAGFEPQQQTESPQMEAQTQIVEDSEQDLATAVQKMVEATNDMVMVTKHLVVATQEMLKATQGKTAEATAAKQDIPQMQQTSQAPRQEVATGTRKQPPIAEQEVVNAMRDAVLATQKAIEAMNLAVPKNLEPKQ